MNPIFKTIIKSYKPEIKNGIHSAEKAIIDYLSKIPLQDGETEIVIFSQVKDEKVYIVVGAFDHNTLKRAILCKPLSEFMEEIISKIL